MGLLDRVLALCTQQASPPPAPAPKPATFDELLLLEYAIKRYEEMHDLLLRSRQTGQTLLGWQTTLLLATLGVEAKARLLQWSPHRWILLGVALAIPIVFLVALLMSGRVAFWTEPSKVPPDPAGLYEEFCGKGIDVRKICDSINKVYSATREIVQRLQRRLKQSVKWTLAGILLLILLFVLISFAYPTVLDELFTTR